MTPLVDDSYLDKIGIIKDAEYRSYISNKVLELLNMQVANRIAEIIDENQLREMTSLPDGRKADWLENNIPDFKNFVQEELENIVTHLKAVTPS
jgi:hypothetical protein